MKSRVVSSAFDAFEYQPIKSWADHVEQSEAKGFRHPKIVPVWAAKGHLLVTVPVTRKDTLRPRKVTFDEGPAEVFSGPPAASANKKRRNRSRSSQRQTETERSITALCGLLDGLNMSTKPPGTPKPTTVLEHRPPPSACVRKQESPVARAPASKRYHPYLQCFKQWKDPVRAAPLTQRNRHASGSFRRQEPPVTPPQPPVSKPPLKAATFQFKPPQTLRPAQKGFNTSMMELCRLLEEFHLSPAPSATPAPAPSATPAPAPPAAAPAPAPPAAAPAPAPPAAAPAPAPPAAAPAPAPPAAAPAPVPPAAAPAPAPVLPASGSVRRQEAPISPPQRYAGTFKQQKVPVKAAPVYQRRPPAPYYKMREGHFRGSSQAPRYHPYSVAAPVSKPAPKASMFLFKMPLTFNFQGMHTWCEVPTNPPSKPLPPQHHQSSAPNSFQRTYRKLPDQLQHLVIS